MFLQSFKRDEPTNEVDQVRMRSSKPNPKNANINVKQEPIDDDQVRVSSKNIVKTEDVASYPTAEEQFNNQRGGKRPLKKIKVEDEECTAEGKRQRMNSSDLDDQKEIETLKDLMPVILSRSKLIVLASKSEKFMDVVKHCYVRMLNKTDKMNHHTLYRVLKGVDTEVPIGKSKYSKRIKLENQAERLLESVDEEPMTQQEFELWIQNVRQKEQPLPTVQWVRKRANDIRNAHKEALQKLEITTVEHLLSITLVPANLITLLAREEGRQLVEGCFVRQSSNGRAMSKIAEIAEVLPTAPYFAIVPSAGKFKVDYELRLRYAGNFLGNVRINDVSSSEINAAEFESMSSHYLKSAIPLPTEEFVEKRWMDINEYLDKNRAPAPKQEIE